MEGLAQEKGGLKKGKPPPGNRKEGVEEWEEFFRSLDMLGAVGGAVVFLMGDERGQAAEFDVAQPTVAGVTVLDRGDHWGFGDGMGRSGLVHRMGRPDGLPQDLRHR